MNERAIDRGTAIFACADELGLAAQGLIASGCPVEAVVSSLNVLYCREMARISGGPDPLGDQIERNPSHSEDDHRTTCTLELGRVVTDLAGRGFSPDAVAHALMVALVKLNKGRPTPGDLLEALCPVSKPMLN